MIPLRWALIRINKLRWTIYQHPEWPVQRTISLKLRNWYGHEPRMACTLLLDPWRELFLLEGAEVLGDVVDAEYAHKLEQDLTADRFDVMTCVRRFRIFMESLALNLDGVADCYAVQVLSNGMKFAGDMYRKWAPKHRHLFNGEVDRVMTRLAVDFQLDFVNSLPNFMHMDWRDRYVREAFRAGAHCLSLCTVQSPEPVSHAWFRFRDDDSADVTIRPSNDPSWWTARDRARAHYIQGKSFACVNEFRRASVALSKALEETPDDVEIQYTLASYLEQVDPAVPDDAGLMVLLYARLPGAVFLPPE